MLNIGVHFQGQGAVATVAQCGFKAFCQALLHVGAHFDAVYHHVYVVFLVFVERRQFVIERIGFAINAHPREALHAQIIEQLHKFAFAARYRGRQHHDFGVFRHGQHAVHHL